MIDDVWAFDITREGRTCTVRVSGEIDMSVSPDVFAVIAAELDRPGTDLVRVDLTAVSYLGSAALAVLVKAKNVAHDHGPDFTIIGANGLPLQVLEITGLLSVLTEMQRSHAPRDRRDPPAGTE